VQFTDFVFVADSDLGIHWDHPGEWKYTEIQGTPCVGTECQCSGTDVWVDRRGMYIHVTIGLMLMGMKS